MTVSCGFIGLGSQGAPIARRMIDGGFPVTLWARRPETLEPYRDGPARFAATIEELGRASEHVGLCVVDDDDVRQVCDALVPSMAPGGRIVIHSTINPDTCREIQGGARSNGLDVIDAPVSGGGDVAAAGALTVMVGGEAEAVAAARPVFETFGRLIVHLGSLGAGQQAKLINNTLLAANIGLADAALAAGERLAIDRAALVELLLASSGRSFGLEVRARMASPRTWERGGGLLAKDVRLLGELLGRDDQVFARLRDAAEPFLKEALGGVAAH